MGLNYIAAILESQRAQLDLNNALLIQYYECSVIDAPVVVSRECTSLASKLPSAAGCGGGREELHHHPRL